jgi:RNA polymerase sporulation-specific sigma factor
MAKSGDETAWEDLIAKYHPVVKAKAYRYFLSGAKREDVIHEGRIGLWRAVEDFSEERGVPVLVFAALCVRRQIFTAVKAATR